MLAGQIRDDLTVAMKAGDDVRRSTLRLLLSELNYKQIELQRTLVDEDVVGVIRKEVKKRREAIESFRAGGREEQAQAEAQEARILEGYLPAQLTEEQIKIELAGMGLPVDFGAAMRIAAPAFRGRADGATVARLVKESLQE